MFFAHCLNPVDGSWTPAVSLRTAREAYQYLALHHGWTREIRIVDADDCIVLQMQDAVLKIPLPDGSLREMPLTPALLAVIATAPEDAP